MESQWSLGDAEATHREFPRTFSIPRGAVRRALPAGCRVKLVFRLKKPVPGGPRAERLWCRVLEQQGETYVGELLDRPESLTDLAPGSRVRFEARHVAAVTWAEARPMRPLVGADLGVLRDGLQPAWLARVDPVDGQDSGWRVFSAPVPGARVRAVTATRLFEAWPPLDTVLDGATSGVWSWSEDALEFVTAPALPEALQQALSGGLGRLHREPAPPEHQAVVSRAVLDRFPVRAERLPPSKAREADSGWCFFVGDETAAQLDDANTFTAVALGRLMVLYPVLERLTGEPGEYAWEWDDALGDYRRSE